MQRVSFLILLALASASPAATRAAVEGKLRSHELPPSAASFSALGSGIDERLVEIGGDGKVELLIRARAIAALAYFPTSVGRKFLEETIAGKRAATEPGDRLLLRKAAVALGWMGGLGVPEKLGPLLDHGDPDVRLDAAIGLGLTRLKSAADLMRKRFDIEPSPRVRSQIARQLRVIDEVAAAKR